MQTLKTKILQITLFVIAVCFLLVPVALAAPVGCSGGSCSNPSPAAPSSLSPYGTHPCHPELDKQADGSDQPGQALDTQELNACLACTKNNPTTAELNNCLKKNPIVGDINTIINFLSAGAGIIIVGSIIVGGIQYAIAGNNPNQVSAAKQRIVNSLIALVAFFLIFAFLSWIVPGGLLFK